MSKSPLQLSRRGFVQLATGGMVAGATLGSSTNAHAFGLGRTPEAPVPDREVPSFCELCFWNCGLTARVKGNRVLSLKGHPQHPNAQGRLCGRGNAGAAQVVDKDRLKYPMLRVGQRGEGRFERIGWREAYRRIAEGFDRIKKEHGAQALALLYHGTSATFLRTMMVAYGSPNFAAPSYAQCKGPRNVGYALTLGEKLPSPEPLDLDAARCMVLFGSHLGENAHNSQVQEFVKARARGAHLVVLDPRFSTVAHKADVWLPVKPGSDLAVILAWMHLLLEQDAYDKAFVERHCVGVEELGAHVKPFTPQWAAEQAGVEPSAILRAYELMRQSMPAVVVHPGRHVTWYGEGDTQRARAQAMLSALLGAWWTSGSTYRPERVDVPEFPGPDFPALPPDVDKAAGRYPFAQEVTTNGIRDATRTGKPYPVKGWFVHGTNLLQCMPHPRETLEAIHALDLLVVCDVLPTEITRYADILLPEDVYLERFDDLQVGSAREPYVCLRQPAVVSPYDTRPAWRIAKELGTELGLGEFFAYRDMEHYLETRLNGTGISLDQLKKEGVVHRPRKGSLYLAVGEDFHFHTPSGKVELFSQQLKDAGFDPMPVYKPQPSPPAGQFRLLYGRSPLHTFGRTQNNPILHDLEPDNALWMHPQSASAAGLKDGDRVTVHNASGDVTGPLNVKVTERMPPDAVYMVHGFGHRANALSRAHGRGGDDNAVIKDYVVDPISGCTGMRTQFVSVKPASGRV